MKGMAASSFFTGLRVLNEDSRNPHLTRERERMLDLENLEVFFF